ncbi:hypothetical protein VOLCADRAFT_116520 [Volvox carteri f. nagariensis]|uniref:Uncharacterized protein n=1 Tax=Volvox carteri f. nagariensis TaxID=3068 RepID=D8TMR7_VOLCA|nr:uncharacterized protein VOLCADRAFT_116520 [Volvox carteri f. nagariensis]EFJ51174.1 hypothetical protein VOLCADRAFT_116520 [Volvox carteri f. nagariensis]|eukprot:XP_002947641.1 hypothetical protein VOLCADRAFT_116520 [Volvox carteri f. nagariensis]
MLEDHSACCWPTVYKYGMCPCGFVYRGDAKALTCPACVPGTSKLCGKAHETHQKTFLYSSIIQYLQRIYSNSTTAAEYGDWLNRLEQNAVADPHGLYDIGHGKAVQAVLQNDPRFKQEPRNVIVVLITDPFIVPVDESERSSTPWLLVAVNTPVSKRHKLEYTSVLGIVGGNMKPPGAKKGVPMDPNHVLVLIKDEVAFLEEEGYFILYEHQDMIWIHRDTLLGTRGLHVASHNAKHGCVSKLVTF